MLMKQNNYHPLSEMLSRGILVLYHTLLCFPPLSLIKKKIDERRNKSIKNLRDIEERKNNQIEVWKVTTEWV